jgi:hypothetical protein
MLRGHERGARIHEFLLRIEDVEGGALADPCFFAHAVERDFRARHLRLSRATLNRLGAEPTGADALSQDQSQPRGYQAASGRPVRGGARAGAEADHP